MLACFAIFLTGCAVHSTPGMKSPHRSTARTSPTTQPILYYRTGGIAGTDDRVVIWPDGFVQVHGKLLGDAEVLLPAERLRKLWTILGQEPARAAPEGGWTLRSTTPAPAATGATADAYRITIFASGRREEADDITAPLLKMAIRFVDAYTEIEAIAGDAVTAAANKAPAPAP